MDRFDYERNSLAAEVYNADARRRGSYTGIFPPPPVENFRIDTTASGYTIHGMYGECPVEFKTITDRFGDTISVDGEWGRFYTDKACRNDKVRWKEGAPEKDVPLHYINKAKYDKLIKGKGALLFITKHGLVVFGYRELKKALVGVAEVYGRLTTEFDDRYGWEDKAVLDMDRYTRYINYEFPREIWHDQHRDS